MLACVIEPSCLDQKTWDGTVGMELGKSMYIAVTDFDDQVAFDSSVKQLHDAICEVKSRFEASVAAALANQGFATATATAATTTAVITATSAPTTSPTTAIVSSSSSSFSSSSPSPSPPPPHPSSPSSSSFPSSAAEAVSSPSSANANLSAATTPSQEALARAFAILQDPRRVADAVTLQALLDDQCVLEASDLGACSKQVIEDISKCLKGVQVARFLQELCVGIP